MRRVPVEDLGNLAESLVFNVPPEFRQPAYYLFARLGRSPIDLHVSGDKRAHQPWPDSPLMIGAIAARRIPLITAAILWVGRRKSAKTVRCEQMPFDRGEHALRLFTRQHAMKEADCEDLVGPYSLVAAIAVNDVVETSHGYVPELLAKTVASATSQLLVVCAGDVAPKALRQVFHGPQRVVPECFNL